MIKRVDDGCGGRSCGDGECCYSDGVKSVGGAVVQIREGCVSSGQGEKRKVGVKEKDS